MVIIDKEKCVGCGKCITDCVAGNLEFVDNKANVKGACLQCGHCVAICKSDAVTIPEYDMDDVEIIDSDNKIDPNLLLKCIKSRRSIRDFTEKKISEDDMKLLAEAGRYTATANNGQFHKYIFIQDELDKLKDMVWGYIDAGLAAQNMELMAYSLDMGVLYNGFLVRIADISIR